MEALLHAEDLLLGICVYLNHEELRSFSLSNSGVDSVLRSQPAQQRVWKPLVQKNYRVQQNVMLAARRHGFQDWRAVYRFVVQRNREPKDLLGRDVSYDTSSVPDIENCEYALPVPRNSNDRSAYENDVHVPTSKLPSDVKYRFKCPLKLSQLGRINSLVTVSSDEDERTFYCHICQRSVQLVFTEERLREVVSTGTCVAYDPERRFTSSVEENCVYYEMGEMVFSDSEKKLDAGVDSDSSTDCSTDISIDTSTAVSVDDGPAEEEVLAIGVDSSNDLTCDPSPTPSHDAPLELTLDHGFVAFS
ncbi:MAG: hypothetical protein MHM6MM_005987 [Cercozoa sp. M6MM]